MLTWERMRIDPAYRERLRAEGLDSVSRVLARIDGRIAAWSRSTETLFVAGHDGLPGLYLKRYYFPTWRMRLRGALRGTLLGLHHGHAEFLSLRDMRWTGVPAIRPLAYGCRLVLGFVSACVLITEEVPDSINLTTFAQLAAAGTIHLSHAGRARLIRTLAERIAEMHAAGYSHGNLFWRNILVRETPDGGHEFFFLDAQPQHGWERLGASAEWWQRELAQLLVSARPFTSRADRLRFAKHYFNDARLTPEIRAHLRQCESLTDAWGRHEQRRIRMNRLFDSWNAALDAEAREFAEPRA